MKVIRKSAVVAWMFVLGFSAYGQEITVEKIYTGAYRTKGIAGISSLRDGEHYTVLEKEGIVKYAYKNSTKIGVIVKGSFEGYTFSDDESKVLLRKKSEKVYRHSYLGKFEILDLVTGKTTQLYGAHFVQEPKFSPDGKKVAFVAGNNLYYQDLENHKVVQITNDGEKNKIINGLADWVYEEEFGHARMFDWNKNSDALVFVRFDESEVPEVRIPIYGKNLYPTEMRFKYPKAGEKNSVVSAHLYQLASGNLQKIDLSQFKNYYIPNVFQTNGNDEVILVTSERIQNASDVLKINTKNGAVKKLFTETDSKWIDNDDATIAFLPDNSFLWASERDGNRHIYHYNKDGKLLKQVTKGNWQVTDYYGFDAKRNSIYLQTTQQGSINRVIAKVNLKNGKSTLLSGTEGTYSANFSQNFSYFIETHSSAKKPNTFVLKNNDGKQVQMLRNNDELLTQLKADGMVNKEFFTIPNAVGDEMNAYILKPKNFDPNKKYPVLMFQYSGPGSQQVKNAWDGGNGLWFNHLTQQGYIVVCVDGRGTGYKGTAYKKATYMNLGKYEIEDQITAAKWLGKQSYIDKDRIGIFGWSFGGYMASLALTKGADVFKLGIAVAPVTNWRYYDTIYTERFMRTPQENPSGYDENSPTTHAGLLKGNFLMIHGTADDNVHYQNAVEFAEELIQKNKQFEFMTYPDKDHGIYGGNTRIQLYNKMTKYIKENL